MPQYFSISDGKSSQFDRPDSISIYDWNIKNSYKMPYYPYCYGSLDSIFGNMKWEEVKYRHNKAVELGTFKIQKAPTEIIEASDYKQEGYCWEKIPIKNYNINIQVPIGSKIKIANDTLSANITFPDSTYISIQYTKGLSGLKLTENETNPRQRRVSRIRVTKKMVSSWGEFEHDGKDVYWQRERYRYGVTLTLYASSWNKFSKYYKPIFGTLTIVMRPKYKTIYLKD